MRLARPARQGGGPEPHVHDCQDTCPLVAQQIRGALDDLSGGRARRRCAALALSVDPANDTPDQAQAFLLERRVRGYLDFLLGHAARAAAGVARVRLRPADRRAGAQLLRGADRQRGRQRVGFPVNYLTPEALAHDLELLLRTPQRGRSSRREIRDREL